MIFLIVQVDKDESGQTISHFTGILPRKIDYYQGKWTITVRGHKYLRRVRREKELEYSQEVRQEIQLSLQM